MTSETGTQWVCEEAARAVGGARLPPDHDHLKTNSVPKAGPGSHKTSAAIWLRGLHPHPVSCIRAPSRGSQPRLGRAQAGGELGGWGRGLKLKNRHPTFSWTVYLCGVAGGAGGNLGWVYVPPGPAPQAWPQLSKALQASETTGASTPPCVGGTSGDISEMPCASWLGQAVLGDGGPPPPPPPPMPVSSTMPGPVACQVFLMGQPFSSSQPPRPQSLPRPSPPWVP